MSGLLGYGACQASLEGADLLLMLGTDFPYDQFLPSGVRTAQVDIAPTLLGRRTRMDLVLHRRISTRSFPRELTHIPIPALSAG